MDKMQWFIDARYGMFIHYGLYSLIGRGEWVLNREEIPVEEYKKLAQSFTAEHFDADDLIRRAKGWGMRYAVLTTKHHDGFCLYDSQLTDFTSVNSVCGRDLVAEFVSACRKHGLRMALYCSLNDWISSPDAVDALENPDKCHQEFIDRVHGHVRELLTNYGNIDVLWYDGWWPFDAEGWQAEELHAMARSLQPDILMNDRSGIKGDFRTPEGHMTSFKEPWEACMTLNENWGYHAGDNNWKSPKDVAVMLAKAASGVGNLLLNIGPKGDGSIPVETIQILDRVSQWLETNGEAIYGTDRFEWYLQDRGDGRSDWTHHGAYTARGDAFYLHVVNWPGKELTVCGVQNTVREVTILATGEKYDFSQQDGKIVVTNLPEQMDATMPVVIKFKTDGEAGIYKCGGMRIPKVEHCPYDPMPSDLLQ